MWNSGNQESEESKKEDGVSRGKSTSNSLTDKQVSVSRSLFFPAFLSSKSKDSGTAREDFFQDRECLIGLGFGDIERREQPDRPLSGGNHEKARLHQLLGGADGW